MSDLSWLKRSFDPRLRYVLGLPFWFLMMLVFFEIVPIPELPEGWRNPAQMVLLLTLGFVCLCVYAISAGTPPAELPAVWFPPLCCGRCSLFGQRGFWHSAPPIIF